jgi:hypothetical protein
MKTFTNDDIGEIAKEAKDVFFIYVKMGMSTEKDVVEIALDEKIANLNRQDIQVFVQHTDPAKFDILKPMVGIIYAFIPGNSQVMMSGTPNFFLLDNPHGEAGNFTRAMWHLDARKNNMTILQHLEIHAPLEAEKIREQQEKGKLLQNTASQVFTTDFEEARQQYLAQFTNKSLEEIVNAVAPLEIAEERFNICGGCDKFNKEIALCNECGCSMATKVNIKNASCPLSKWVN